MKSVHINAIVTYPKALSELRAFGYLHYLPSYHPLKGSAVTCVGLRHENAIDRGFVTNTEFISSVVTDEWTQINMTFHRSNDFVNANEMCNGVFQP